MTTLRATPSNSIAPWASIVPDAPYPLTVEDMLALPDDGYIYELVDGVLLRMAGNGGRATVIGGNMYAALRAFVLPRRLGVATPADGVYKFPGAETGLIPDAGYYRAERLDFVSDQSKPLPFAPDLAAEVACTAARAWYGSCGPIVRRSMPGAPWMCGPAIRTCAPRQHDAPAPAICSTERTLSPALPSPSRPPLPDPLG